jgi:hypothetical protein
MDPDFVVNYDVTRVGRGTWEFSGFWNEIPNVESVEFFEGGQPLGLATLAPDDMAPGSGEWDFDATLAKGSYDAFSAVATDAAGDTFSASANVMLQLGIRHQPYTAWETGLDALGRDISDLYTKANGEVYLGDYITYRANGGYTVEYSAGTFFDGLDYKFIKQIYSSDGTLQYQDYRNNDHTTTIVGSTSGAHILTQRNDTITAGGNNETFVFTAFPGPETITDFQATGPGHDVISLPRPEWGSIGHVLSEIVQSGANTIIQSGDEPITLDNVRASALTASDFSLHKGSGLSFA